MKGKESGRNHFQSFTMRIIKPTEPCPTRPPPKRKRKKRKEEIEGEQPFTCKHHNTREYQMPCRYSFSFFCVVGLVLVIGVIYGVMPNIYYL